MLSISRRLSTVKNWPITVCSQIPQPITSSKSATTAQFAIATIGRRIYPPSIKANAWGQLVLLKAFTYRQKFDGGKQSFLLDIVIAWTGIRWRDASLVVLLKNTKLTVLQGVFLFFSHRYRGAMPAKSVAVIGTGPAGAIAVDALAQEKTFDSIRVFERQEQSGGCWWVLYRSNTSLRKTDS